ncbi:Nan1 protein [Saccharomycopsis crataegensis]|uniref:Nan1 protein n=1 Tax=Saccharomycopsis crataegensis TaxID=43959 RepID=A0AAV5QSP6_9ASCO|nr:Nan1 protein [Saccharomycopsis crataegensis]
MTSVSSKNKSWNLFPIGGGKPLRTGSTYSPDNKYFIQPFNSSLKVYYISTRQCVKTIPNLELDTLVASRIDPLQPNLLWVFKSTGEFSIINWKDRAFDDSGSVVVYESGKLSTLENLNDIIDFRFNYSLNSYEIMTICGKSSQKSHSSGHKKTLNKVLIKVNEKINNNQAVAFKDIDIENSVQIQELISIKKVLMFAKSLDSRCMVFLTESSSDNNSGQMLELKVVELKSFNIHNEQSHLLQKKSTVTALSISNNKLVAIGLYSGVVEVLYNFVAASSDNSNNSKILRWHMNPVGALNFTKDSNYLLTGGQEKVLVFWQIASDKLQFLPRLNGNISQISTNYFPPDNDSTKNNDGIDYYTLVLDIPSSQNNDFDVLVLNSIELTSRLSITSLKLNTKNPVASLNKEKKRLLTGNGDDKLPKILKIQKDYTLSGSSEINSVDKNLYMLSGSEIQSFSLLKNEQMSSLNVVPKISIGKVKTELNLTDPKVNLFKFTEDGEWLITVDEYETPSVDNLITKGEVSYSLKFWKRTNDAEGKNSSENHHWELATKIVDPHGANVKILEIVTAPSGYFKGTAFLTADAKGGIRLWRPQQPKLSYNIAKANKLQPTAWTLRKFITSLISGHAENVSVAWSEDSTLILMSLGNNIYKIPLSNFDNWSYLTYNKQLVNSKNINCIKLINNDSNLLVFSDEFLLNYNLINDKVVYEYKVDGNKLDINEKLVSFDPINKRFTVGFNYFETKGSEINESSAVLVFDYHQPKPTGLTKYNHYISAVKWLPGTENFIILDTTHKISLLDYTSLSSHVPSLVTILSGSKSETADNFAEEMVSLVQTSKPISFAKPSGHANNNNNDDDDDVDMIDDDNDKFWYGKRINNHTFESVLNNNLENMDMEDLFNSIVECI